MYLEGLLHLPCMLVVAFHNLSVLITGIVHKQNEEITVIPLLFILLLHVNYPEWKPMVSNDFYNYELTSLFSLEEAMLQINQERLLNLQISKKGFWISNLLFKSGNSCAWTFRVWVIVSFCEKAVPVISEHQLIGVEQKP